MRVRAADYDAGLFSSCAGRVVVSETMVRMVEGFLDDDSRMPGGFNVSSGGCVQERDEVAWMRDVVLPVAFAKHRRRADGVVTMLELGAFRGSYSLKFVDAAVAEGLVPRMTLVEPDAANLECGKDNFAANGHCDGDDRVDVAWLNGMICGGGRAEGVRGNFVDVPGAAAASPCVDVASILRSREIDTLDLLHMDIQGSELGALRLTPLDRVHQVIVATHSDALHAQCLEILETTGLVVVRQIPPECGAFGWCHDGYLHAVWPAPGRALRSTRINLPCDFHGTTVLRLDWCEYHVSIDLRGLDLESSQALSALFHQEFLDLCVNHGLDNGILTVQVCVAEINRIFLEFMSGACDTR